MRKTVQVVMGFERRGNPVRFNLCAAKPEGYLPYLIYDVRVIRDKANAIWFGFR